MAFGRARAPDPKNAALLVVDMQEFFRDTGNPILGTVQKIVGAARSAGVPVVYTRHSHKSPDDFGMLGEWWGNNLIRDGTPEAEIMPEVDRRETDKVVHKNTYSGFHKTDLEKYLRECGRTEVIVTGVLTNCCCETTARDAFNRGFRVFFCTDGTATVSDELHNATLKTLAYGFAYMVQLKDIQDALRV